MMWWAVSRAGAIKFTPEKYKNPPRKYSTDLISWKDTSNDRVGTDYIECVVLSLQLLHICEVLKK